MEQMLVILNVTNGNPDHNIQVYAWALVLFGIITRYLIGRSRFNRNYLNRQDEPPKEYHAYLKQTASAIAERLSSGIANLALIAGLILLLISWFNGK